MKNLINDENRHIFYILTLFFLIKILLFQFIPILNDEAYVLTISKDLSLSYFDHPPLTMWILYFLSEHIGLENPILFRLPFILFGTLTSYFLYLIGKLLYSKNVGILSAILYFASPFFFFSGGMLIVPDGPLNFFVVSSFYYIAKIIFYKKEGLLVEWLFIGILIALAFLSKYQAYFFGSSLIIYFFVWKRVILISNKFIISVFIASMGLLPVIIWNFQNDFVSFVFHQERSTFSIQPGHFFALLFIQFFLILPTTAIVIILSFFNNKKSDFKEVRTFFYVLALPPIVFFNLINFFSGNSFAHWSMIGWLLLIPVGANFITSLTSLRLKTYFLKVINVVFVFFFIFIILIHSRNGFITAKNEDNVPLAKWDNTKEILDWLNIAKILKNHLNTEELRSLVTLNWYYSGQLSTAFSFEHEIGVIGKNDHHFRYMKIEEKVNPIMIDIQLLNEVNNNFVGEKLDNLGYKTVVEKSVPFSRGKSVYGHIKIYFIKRK